MKKILPVIVALTFSFPSFSQDSGGDYNSARVEKLERDLMLLQRQISRSGGGSSVSSGTGTLGGSADLEVRLSAIEENMRSLLGKTEENEFQIKKLTQNLEKMQRDTDFRFGELTGAPKSTSTAPPTGSLAAPTPTTSVATSVPTDENTLIKPRNAADSIIKDDIDKHSRPIGKTVDTIADGGDENEEEEHDTATAPNFADAREHYNYAFRLLNQTEYDKSFSAFTDFIKKYPKNPLIGNAYYWQGEILYIKRNYVKAADNFRQGFEYAPTGSKAPDNLLKLAMSLNALKRDKEACVVLKQVVSKFKSGAAAVSQKADQEQKRIGCN